MHEGIAVERGGIRLANARFAELCGAASPADLVGRTLTDALCSRIFSELLAGHLRAGHHAGSRLPRLEVELPAAAGHASRVELALSPTTFEGEPALLVSAVEMSPAREPVHRAHANAWEALDAGSARA